MPSCNAVFSEPERPWADSAAWDARAGEQRPTHEEVNHFVHGQRAAAVIVQKRVERLELHTHTAHTIMLARWGCLLGRGLAGLLLS